MSARFDASRSNGSPLVTWGIVLAVIFSVEFLIMRIIPHVLGDIRSTMLEASVDSIALTAFAAPLLWFLIVLPLKRAATVRERFLADMFTAVEEERRRVAREVHDGVGQSLTLVISGLRSVPDLAELEATRRRCADLLRSAQDALAEVKRLSLGLRPSLLDDFGLRPALTQLIADVEKHSGLTVRTELDEMVDRRWSDGVETHLFRIVQEGLGNVVQHAQAASARVRIGAADGRCELEITDDGRGIDAAKLQAAQRSGGHLGIIGIQERAKLLQGSCRIEAIAPHGTRLVVVFPLPEPKR